MALIDGGALVAKALKKEGIDNIFGLVGYQVSPIFVGCENEDITIYDVRHEQAAVHMADGYAQLTGKPGVATMIGGPGFANATMGILKAYYSNTPMIVITGAFDPSKRDTGGLQDLDQLSCVRNHTQWCGTVFDVKRIPEYIAIAIRNATTGKRGPVVLEIPINILTSKVEEDEIQWPEGFITEARQRGDGQLIENAITLIDESEKPIIVAGNGVFYSKGFEELQKFVGITGIPVYTVNAGRGAIADDHEFCLGSGRPLDAGSQLYAYKNADLIINLGNSLDYSFFFLKGPIFNKDVKVVQVDIDPCEIGKSSRKIDVGIVGDSSYVLEDMVQAVKNNPLTKKFDNWVAELKSEKDKFEQNILAEAGQKKSDDYVQPIEIIDIMNEKLPKDSIVVNDGSNAMFWGSQFFKTYSPGHSLIGPSGTYGPMGSGLGLALGAKIAKPDKTVVLYTGDGSVGFDFIDIESAIRLDIPIIIVIHNDKAWGFCRETQRLLFNKVKGTELGLINYEKVSEVFGGDGYFVTDNETFEEVFEKAVQSNRFSIINVVVDPSAMSPGANFLNNAHKIYKEFA